MTAFSRRRATQAHRTRSTARGIVRIEVQTPQVDSGLIRRLAEVLREGGSRAAQLRAEVARALDAPGSGSVLDLFGSDLPDSVFHGVFDAPRDGTWREIDL